MPRDTGAFIWHHGPLEIFASGEQSLRVPVPVISALYQPFPMTSAARAQVWRYSPRYLRPRHFHLEPELNLIAAGSGVFGAGDAELKVSAGDLLCWAPGQDHELIAAAPDLEMFVVGVTPELADRVLGPGAAVTGSTSLRIDPATLARLRALCASGSESSPQAVEARVVAVWREAHDGRTGGSGKHAVTRRALRSLLGEPDLTRRDLARLVRSHPSQVSRLFHADMRLTLTTYRTRLMLLRFIQAVDAGAETLLAAALEAGFGSYSQLHRVFQQTLGTTPRTFFSRGERERMGDAFVRESRTGGGWPPAPT